MSVVRIWKQTQKHITWWFYFFFFSICFSSLCLPCVLAILLFNFFFFLSSFRWSFVRCLSISFRFICWANVLQIFEMPKCEVVIRRNGMKFQPRLEMLKIKWKKKKRKENQIRKQRKTPFEFRMWSCVYCVCSAIIDSLQILYIFIREVIILRLIDHVVCSQMHNFYEKQRSTNVSNNWIEPQNIEHIGKSKKKKKKRKESLEWHLPIHNSRLCKLFVQFNEI